MRVSKKIMGFFLMIVLCVSYTTFAYAADDIEVESGAYEYEQLHMQYVKEASKNGNTFTEFDYLMALENLHEEELLAAGYSTEFVNELTNGEIEAQMLEEVNRRATLNSDILSGLGYAADEIEKMKNLTGDESLEELSTDGLLATITVYNNLSEHYYESSSNKTYFMVAFGWSWDKMPTALLQDCLGMLWNQDFALDNSMVPGGYDIKCNRVYLNYTLTDGGTDLGAQTLSEVEINKAECGFAMAGDYDRDGTPSYWISGGYGVAGLSQTGVVDNAKFEFAYAHSKIGVGSVSVSVGTGLSFDTTIGILIEEYRPDSIVNSQTAERR